MRRRIAYGILSALAEFLLKKKIVNAIMKVKI